MALDSTDSELNRTFLMDDSNGDSNLIVECISQTKDDCTSSNLLEVANLEKVSQTTDASHTKQTPQLFESSDSENPRESNQIDICKSLALDSALFTSSECITEAEDACTSSSLLEVGNNVKVLELFDVIHNGQTSQLVDSSEPENTKEMDNINLCESLALDNAFIKSAECITETEDNCTSSSLVEVGNSVKVLEIFDFIHDGQTSQLVDSSEPEYTKEMDKINLGKSLTQDNAFIKSAGCILEADDNCTISNLQEVANIEKVLERIDVSHNDETPQLVLNSEPGRSKEIDKIKLHKSVASDNAFITSAECILEAEDNDCTSSNPTEVANFEKVLEVTDVCHNEQTTQLVESSEPESTEEIGKINLCKSLVLNNVFITSEECTTESEDDCTSFNLLEVGNIEIVMETTDASHNEQRPQLVESSEPESTRESDLINFHQTLSPDNAFTECITEAEDDCTDFSLLEVGNIDKVLEISDVIHNKQTPQLVESSELETTKEIDLINFHKSLAPDNAFAEYITKAEDDCTSFNLKDVGYIEKVFETTVVSHSEQTPQLVNSSEFKSNIENVLEIIDVSHSEQTHQLVESSETKSTTKIDKMHLCQSLAQDAFITSEECFTEAENDCTSFNLLEVGNNEKVLEIAEISHNEQTAQLFDSSEFKINIEKVLETIDVSHNVQTHQLVESSKPESTKEIDEIHLCKSLVDDACITSSECITEAEDDCTSFNLDNIEKVLEITDVTHNVQTHKLVESSEPESTTEMEKIYLCKSLAHDAFITGAECGTKAEDDCTSFNLLEVGNIEKVLEIADINHNEQTRSEFKSNIETVLEITDVSHNIQTHQLVESSKPESTTEIDKIHLCKSLGDDAFITSSECITEVEDDCTSSNLLEVCIIEKVLEITNISHIDQTPQLVESSELECTKEIVTSAECVTESENDCTSSNLLELVNVEVSKMTDVSHNELLPQLVEYPEPESTREVDKIDRRKCLAGDNTFNKSAEFIIEAKDDCKTSNLVEVAISEKVMGIIDVSHNEQTSQLVESLEPESTREISKINLSNSLVPDDTFFKSAECIPEAKEDCTSSNLLKIANIEVMEITDVSHKNETLQLVESSELERSRKNSKIDMRKSLAWDSAFLTNAECILEAKDDCTSSILLEVADIEKVPEITDVRHREQTSQLAESSKPESRRKVSKVDLRKSLAWDSAFFTSAECILDVEDDFSSSNLLEGSDLEKAPEMTDVSHKEQTPQLVESSEPESLRKTSKINLRKSLAWNNAFFTSAGVLDAQELSIMIDGADRGKTPALPGIEEDVRGSMDTISTLDSDCLTLESLEADLFLDVRASIQKASKVSNVGSSSLKAVSEEKMMKGICASKKTCLPIKNMMRTKPTFKKEAIPGPDRMTKQTSAAATARNGSLNPSNPTSNIAVSKRASIDASRVKSGNGIGKAALSSNYGVPTKVMPKSTLLSSKSTVLAPPPAQKGHPGSSSGLDTTTGRVPLRKKLEPKRFTPASSSTLHKTPSMAVAAGLKKGQSSRDTTGHLSSSKLSSSISPASSISEWSTESSSSISIITSEFQENPTQIPLVNEPHSVKPSGLRMPSPKIGFFDGAKTAAQTTATTNLQPSIPVGLRRFPGRTAGASVGSMAKAVSSSQKASVVTTLTGKNMLNKNASKSTTLLKEGKLSIDSHRISNEANGSRENQIVDSKSKLTNLNLKSLERPPFSVKNTSTFTDSENSPFFRGS